VLVVEDEPALLTLSTLMLETLGYHVLAAGTPHEAIVLAGEYAGRLHLVITDVVMPEMNGRDLAIQLQAMCPGIKTMFMSGYTANVIIQRGVLDDSLEFIQKPFSMHDLAVRIRHALENPRRR